MSGVNRLAFGLGLTLACGLGAAGAGWMTGDTHDSHMQCIASPTTAVPAVQATGSNAGKVCDPPAEPDPTAVAVDSATAGAGLLCQALTGADLAQVRDSGLQALGRQLCNTVSQTTPGTRP